MLTDIKQIQDIDKIYVLKECWNKPCGMNSKQRIINNRWMIPISYIAEQCFMNPIQIIEEHLFASDINANIIGRMQFLKDNANTKGYDLTAIICSTLKYEDGGLIYADITKCIE